MKQAILIFIAATIILIACNNNKTGKQAGLPNDVFREKVISKILDKADIMKFDTLLAGLDKKGITYCQFVQRLSQLDDSCYNIAKEKYPDPENETDFVKLHLQTTDEAESKYTTQLDLNNRLSAFAISVYNNPNLNVRSFCGN